MFIMRIIRLKYVGFILGSLMAYLLLSYYFFDNYTSLSKVSSVHLKHVVVHLDLKGSPPRLKYLISLLPRFKKLGVTGILMEYEDSFPYHGSLANLSSTIPYNKDKVSFWLWNIYWFFLYKERWKCNNIGVWI